MVVLDRPDSCEDDYVCRYSLDVDGSAKNSHAMGVDAVQALQLAMKKIHADLLSIGRELDCPVTWLDDPLGEDEF